MRRAGAALVAVLLFTLAGAAQAVGPLAYSVAVGDAHACAIVTGPQLRCWGAGLNGQLGIGSKTTDQLGPVGPVAIPDSVLAVTAGFAHTCVLTVKGGVICFGSNARGQLGDGSATSTGTGVYPNGLFSGVERVTAGSAHTCALLDDGSVKCWGYDITVFNTKTPVTINGLGGPVAAIDAGGRTTCALVNGKPRCWGPNRVVYDVPSGALLTWKAINVGSWMACGVTAPTTRGGVNAIRCWQPKTDETPVTTPVVVQDTGDYANVAVGADFACGLTVGGAVRCWGKNFFGQLGDATHTDSATPVEAHLLTDGVQQIAAGGSTACAVTAAGEAKCWGWGHNGQVGDGFGNSWFVPTSVIDIGPNTLTITLEGDGYGQVYTTPGETVCPGACVTGWAKDGFVKLTANTLFSSTFAGWGGACSGTGLVCAFSVDGDKTVTATFKKPQVAGPKAYSLQVTKAGSGSGTVTSSPAGVDCGSTCNGLFADGATVTLTAAAAAGSQFTGWSGDCQPSSTSCTATMSADRAVTATFAANAPPPPPAPAPAPSPAPPAPAPPPPPPASAPAPPPPAPAATPPPAARACVVPKLVNEPRAVAVAAIASAGCKLGAVRYGYSRTVKKGRVIWQSPRAGSKPKKPTVTILVSLGKER